LSADFITAEVVTGAGNGKVLSYLSAHAEINRQDYAGELVTVHCSLPRHLLYHIQGSDVEVRFLGNGEANGRMKDEG
jgi:GTP-binding protein HflX